MTSIALKQKKLGIIQNGSAYNKVVITLTTHDVGGLSDKDVILGQFIDKEYEKSN